MAKGAMMAGFGYNFSYSLLGIETPIHNALTDAKQVTISVTPY